LLSAHSHDFLHLVYHGLHWLGERQENRRLSLLLGLVNHHQRAQRLHHFRVVDALVAVGGKDNTCLQVLHHVEIVVNLVADDGAIAPLDARRR